MAILILKDKEFFISYESDHMAHKSKCPFIEIDLADYYWLYCMGTLKLHNYKKCPVT